MHTVISLIELGEADHALTFAVGELATAQTLADGVVDGVGNPAVAALLLAKSAQAAERGIEFAVTPGSVLPPDVAPDHELVTILGNLLDNAFDAVAAVVDRQRRVEVGSALTTAAGRRRRWTSTRRRRSGRGRQPGDGVRIVVSDTGPGLTEEQARSAFTAGWSTKQARGPAGDRGLGLALVAQAVGALRRHRARRTRAGREIRGVAAASGGPPDGRGRPGDQRRGAAGRPRRVGPAAGRRSSGVSIQVLVVEDEPIAARAHRRTSSGSPDSPSPAWRIRGSRPSGRWPGAGSTWCCWTCTCPTATGSTCSAGSARPGRWWT